MMAIPNNETIEKIFAQHHETLELDKLDRLDTVLIGQGEANLNILVTINQAKQFNLRIGLREQESERTLQREYDILQILPANIGPTAFLTDFSRETIAQPFILLSYIKGEIKRQWDIADLETHGQTLARLHRQTFARHGSIGELTTAPYDFLQRFDIATRYWEEKHLYLFDIPVVNNLLPRVRDFIIQHNSLFFNLQQFSITHGDAHPLNIIFNDRSIQYVDWENSAIGDPASDVAMLGWDTDTYWQMQLSSERLKIFLDSYLAIRPDSTLLLRRDSWMVYTMFFDQMYHRTQLPNDPDGRQAYTVQQIEAYLTKRFL